MKVAVSSDIHDNVWNLQAALAESRKVSVDALLYCGDICSPFTAKIILEAFKTQAIPVIFVWGNNDADTARITALTKDYPFLQIHHELAELIVVDDKLLTRKEYGEGYFDSPPGSKRIAVNHYDNIAVPLAKSGMYDVVFFGHNHKYEVTPYGDTLAINPGTLMGYNPLSQEENKNVDATFVIYDTATGEPSGYRIELDGSINRRVSRI